MADYTAKKLSEIARELPPAPVRIAAAGEQRVTLDCGRTHFKILGLPKDEFPAFPNVRFNESWRIRSGDLQKLISHTSFAVSTEESRPILNGVLWERRGIIYYYSTISYCTMNSLAGPLCAAFRVPAVAPPR